MTTNETILDSNISSTTDDRIEIQVVDPLKFSILFVATFGIYGIWWMYKAWRFFKEKEDLDIMPVARAIFSIFFVYSLFTYIQDYAKEYGYTGNYSSGLLFIGYLAFSLAGRLPEPFFLVSFLTFLFFIQPISAFNFALDHSETYKAVRGSFSLRQGILLAVGGIVWVLMLIGLSEMNL